MSHVQQRAIIECPLASLGHNTPTLDNHQGYHHPLSTSPLDPNAYQMLRKSQESPILSLDTDKIRHSDGSRARTHASIAPNLNDSLPQLYLQHLNASSTPEQKESSSAFLSHCDLQRLRNQTYTPIETVLRGSYPHANMPPPHLHRRGQSTFNLDDDPSFHDGLTDVERFFLGEKMSSIFISNSMRNESTSSGDSGTNRSSGKGTKNSSANNSRNFSAEGDQDDRSIYYSIPNGQINEYNSPAGRRRVSSPDTSGSDRYFLDRLRGSPNFIVRNTSLACIQKNISLQKGTQGNMRIGRGTSPSLDQGYHTLNTPSPPSTQQPYIPHHWNTNNNIIKKVNPKPGKGFNRLPNDLIIRIFEWLDSCDLCNLTQVCKKFETLVWSPVLWRNIVIKGILIKQKFKVYVFNKQYIFNFQGKIDPVTKHYERFSDVFVAKHEMVYVRSLNVLC